MESQRRLISIVILILLTGLLLVACERPLPGSSDATVTPDPGSVEVITDENVGGGTPNDSETGTTTEETGSEEAAAEGEGSTDTPREEAAASGETTGDEAAAPAEEGYPAPEDEAAAGEEAPATEGEAAASEEAAAEEGTATEETTTDEAAAETTTTDTTAAETTTTETTEARPASHVVAAGENLYRIGLKYGISWVTLAQHNGIADANRIVVGQEIKIPGATIEEATPTPTPSPLTEEVYTVKAGDTLFRIGQAYGLSWTQIAEANGIVNPNQIIVGQQLKIPVDKPSDTQQSFVHTVQAGETLFLISLRYGVAWPAIAEANELQTPYVIFPGQTLAIPGK